MDSIKKDPEYCSLKKKLFETWKNELGQECLKYVCVSIIVEYIENSILVSKKIGELENILKDENPECLFFLKDIPSKRMCLVFYMTSTLSKNPKCLNLNKFFDSFIEIKYTESRLENSDFKSDINYVPKKPTSSWYLQKHFEIEDECLSD
jgi:hypothetical protein